MIKTEGQTTTPSGADVLDILCRAAGYILCSAGSEHADYRAMHEATDAVAALIARNAELEAQNDEILARNVELDEAMGAMESERDALAAENLALREYAERWRWATANPIRAADAFTRVNVNRPSGWAREANDMVDAARKHDAALARTPATGDDA